MQARAFFIAMLLLGVSAFSQGPNRSAPSRIQVSFSVLPDGHPTVTVRNNYSRSITGFIMIVNPGGAGSYIMDEVRSYHDVYINHHHDRKIGPGNSYTIPVPYIVGADVTKLEPHFMAVVFEDGSTWGDDRWVLKIASMRTRLLEELDVLHGMVERGIQLNSDGHTLLAQIESERAVRGVQDQDAEPEISLIDKHALDNVAEGLRSIGSLNQTSSRANSFKRLRAWMEDWRQALVGASVPMVTNTSHIDRPPDADPQRPSGRARRSGVLLPITLRAKMKMPLMMVQAECTATDSSFVVPAVDNPNNCGTTIWELVATASDGARLDVGQTTAFGQCYGNYTDCQGTFHNPTNTGTAGIKFASHSFLDNNTPAVKFAWSIQNWQAASYQACSCNDPDPDGETETAPTPGFIFSPFWIHDCG